MSWLKTMLFTLLVPGTTVVLLPRLIVSREAGRSTGELAHLGWIPLITGVAIVGWCFARFAHDRGTPSPIIEQPRELVVTGAYRWVRNPIYLGAFSILLGQIILTGSRWLLPYTVAYLGVLHVLVVRHEEPDLRRRFGASYERYLGRVPRWLPRRPPVDARTRIS